MTQLGADPDHLRELARSLRSAAGRLDTLSIGLARRARAAGWHGPDAVRFEQRWQHQLRPALHASADGLGRLARRVEHEADEQIRAAADHGATPAAGTVHSPADVERPPAGVGVDLAAPAPLPRHEQRLQGAVELRAGPVVATLQGDLTLQDLGGGRTRVLLAQVAGAGAAVAAGASTQVGVGGPSGSGATPSGASGGARARLAAVQRRSWEVDDDDVSDLLLRVAVAETSERTTGAPDAAQRLAGVVDGLVELVTGRDPGVDVITSVALDPPQPERHEVLLDVEVQGGAGAGASAVAGLGARAHGVAALRVGRATSSGATSTVVELHGAAGGGLTSSLLRRLGVALPADQHGSVTVRLEAPDDAGTGEHLRMRVTATDEERVHDVLAHVRLDDGGDDALRRAVVAARRGELSQLQAHLADVVPRPEQVALRSADGILSGHQARAGAGAGLGVGGGLTVRGHAFELDRAG